MVTDNTLKPCKKCGKKPIMVLSILGISVMPKCMYQCGCGRYTRLHEVALDAAAEWNSMNAFDRCEMCKFWRGTGGGYCILHKQTCNADWYCNGGEEKRVEGVMRKCGW